MLCPHFWSVCWRYYNFNLPKLLVYDQTFEEKTQTHTNTDTHARANTLYAHHVIFALCLIKMANISIPLSVALSYRTQLVSLCRATCTAHNRQCEFYGGDKSPNNIKIIWLIWKISRSSSCMYLAKYEEMLKLFWRGCFMQTFLPSSLAQNPVYCQVRSRIRGFRLTLHFSFFASNPWPLALSHKGWWWKSALTKWESQVAFTLADAVCFSEIQHAVFHFVM